MNNYLIHYGVLGMKWGVRRFQPKKGTMKKTSKRKLTKKQKIAIGIAATASILLVAGAITVATINSKSDYNYYKELANRALNKANNLSEKVELEKRVADSYNGLGRANRSNLNLGWYYKQKGLDWSNKYIWDNNTMNRLLEESQSYNRDADKTLYGMYKKIVK